MAPMTVIVIFRKQIDQTWRHHHRRSLSGHSGRARVGRVQTVGGVSGARPANKKTRPWGRRVLRVLGVMCRNIGGAAR